jgi:hypothetical protein
VFWGAYTAGDLAPLLRRPIVFGCAQCTARPSDLEICLEPQARLGGCVCGRSSAQGGGETNGFPRLVNVSCEVGHRQCRDILCLVQQVGIRHGVGPSGAPQEGISCILSMITGCRVVTCSMWYGTRQSCSLEMHYTEGCLPATHCRKGSRVPDRGERSYPGDNGAGASLNGGGGNVVRKNRVLCW